MIDHRDADDHIAIVGLALRVPGARNLAEFWANLVNGIESLTEVTDEQALAAGRTRQDFENPNFVRLVPLLDGVAEFDARYFDLSLREGQIMDPQQRQFLEVAHEALESAGRLGARRLAATGVYAGAAQNRYAELHVRPDATAVSALGELTVNIRNHNDYLTTSASYLLGLQGPSVNVATACSTSLVAVHLACEALRNGECDLALAGGSAIEMPYAAGHIWQEGGIFSADGHCRPFDIDATGTTFGSGVGVAVLRRLSDALHDNERILAVIRGSAINNDGADKVGFTAPSVDGQFAAIAEALALADVDPATIGYVEAHGTATQIGDPIEVTALSRAYRQAGSTDKGFCGLGSVKGNVGHLGTAAGIVGLAKVVLALRERHLPPSINFRAPNPRLDLERSPFRVVARGESWISDQPRRAGVSSFGIGGTNAHAVLEEAPEHRVPRQVQPVAIVPVSTKHADALDEYVSSVEDVVAELDSAARQDAAFTFAVGRVAHRYRAAVVTSTDTADDAPATVRRGIAERRPVVYLLPGQGSQYPGMSLELQDGEEVFRGTLRQCASIGAEFGVDLHAFLSDRGAVESTDTAMVQPAVFAVEYALAMLWASWGVDAGALGGHSLGEITAATLAGVFSLEAAMEIVIKRGRMMAALPAGSMVAVAVDEDRALELAGGVLDLAAINGPLACVLSGRRTDVEQLESRLDAEKIAWKRLQTSRAFHSRMMEPMLDRFEELVDRVGAARPNLPLLSNVTGTWADPDALTTGAYWALQLRSPIRFSDCLTTLAADDPGPLLLEVGPGAVLTALARSHPVARDVPAVATLPWRDGSHGEIRLSREALGAVWAHGVQVRWTATVAGEDVAPLQLPTYPFRRDELWLDPRESGRSHSDQVPVDTAAEVAELVAIDQVAASVWHETRSRPLPPTGELVAGGHWLLLSDGSPLAHLLQHELETAGARVTSIGVDTDGDPAPEAMTSQRGYQDFQALLGELAAGNTPPDVIVHLWLRGTHKVDDVVELGFHTTLGLGRALARWFPSRPVHIAAITDGLYDVAGTGDFDPVKSTILGPLRTLGKEQPEVKCSVIDLDVEDTTRDVARRVLAELLADEGDGEVALRGRRRWTRARQSVEVTPIADYGPLLRKHGVYLITGGLGGIGLELARDLAERLMARLVLVGRTPVPDKATWGEHVEGDEEAAPTVQRLLEIEDLGGEVLPLAADVADEMAMRAVIERAREEFGGIDGVFHAAGISSGRMVAVMGREDANAVLRPKVHGTLILDRLLRRQTGFMVLFSSLSAETGTFGLADYAGANAFLDAFAVSRADDRNYVVSIGWGDWAEVGMAVRSANSAPPDFRQLQQAGKSDDGSGRHPLLTPSGPEHRGEARVVHGRIDPDTWMVNEHRVAGVPVLAGTGLLDLAHAAATAVIGTHTMTLSGVALLVPLAVNEARALEVVFDPVDEGWSFTIASAAVEGDGGLVTHATGRVTALLDTPPQAAFPAQIADGEEVVDDGAHVVAVGPHWDCIDSTSVAGVDTYRVLALPAEFGNEIDEHGLHPSLLDQALTSGHRGSPVPYLPFGVEQLAVYRRLPDHVTVWARQRVSSQAELLSWDVEIRDRDDAVIVTAEGFSMRRVNPDLLVLGDSARGIDAESQSPEAHSTPSRSRRTTAPPLDGGAIPVARGLSILRWVLATQPGAHMLVAADGVEQRITRSRGVTTTALVTHGAVDQPPRRTPTDQDPDVDMVSLVIDAWSEALGTDVAASDDFFELGGNSLAAVTIVSRLGDAIGTDVPIVTVFECPTPREFAEALQSLVDAP